MKKVFLDNLPRYTEGHQKGRINWNDSIGIKLKFIYNNKTSTKNQEVEGYFEIINYNKDGQLLTVEYRNIQYKIRTGDIIECKLGKLLKDEVYSLKPDKSKGKWIDLSNLPLNSHGVDWKEISLKRLKIPFRYNSIIGEITIKEFTDDRYLVIEYFKNEYFKIHVNNFLKCKLGEMLKLINHNYKYNIGDIVENNYSKIEIIKQFKKKSKEGVNVKWYKYLCLKCGYKHEIVETSLLSGSGCPVCANKKVLVGYNDITITDEWMIKYFQGGVDEAKLYTRCSGKSIYPICPDCGEIRKKPISINNIYRTRSIGCKCSDGISFPEKFILELFRQLKVNYEYRKSNFKWNNRKEYDFYLMDFNSIVETHGEQHYKKSFHTIHKNSRTLEEEQENDRIKEQLAKENGIKYYIIIDCRKSELTWIKDSVLNSNLTKLFDLSTIDWLKCSDYACKNIIKEVCDIKNINPNYSTHDISKIVNLHSSTIMNYLKKGNELGWCNYNKEDARKIQGLKMRGINHPLAQDIICLNTKEIFHTMTDASKKYNTPISKISMCCRGERNSSGRHPVTNEKLKWMYYNDYLCGKEQIPIIHKLSKKIICITTNEIFNSITDAQNKYNIKNISSACLGKYAYSGKHPETGEPLRWMYYENYIKQQEEILVVS